ncbi:uncharacterized protein LOC143030903 [Oratosquilla oratoria]|uniref:uncharacterized protein LOC143030903 n=1 Tax=Oratosquilla oratoria TaxID=337810 RepID=UPI003F7593B2
MIVPFWLSQPWMGALLRLLVEDPIIIMRRKKVLVWPLSTEEHPIMSHTRLMACLLSGKACENLASWKPGTSKQYRSHINRYKDTWDVKPVLTKLKQLEPLQSLPLKELTLKLVMLMALTQAARVQTLHLLVLKNISIKEEAISVWLGDNIKQCRPGFNIQSVKFFPYTKDESLCVCRTLRTYLEKTEHLRDETGKKDGRLLISFIKPHKPVSRDTIARWIKHVLTISGIDSTKYTASSVRSAAASQARSMSVPIRHIMSKAGWSRESTFAKHYNKEIVQEGDPFQDAVLD